MLALVEALKIRSFAFCGLSLGGTISEIDCLSRSGTAATGLILANACFRASVRSNSGTSGSKRSKQAEWQQSAETWRSKDLAPVLAEIDPAPCCQHPICPDRNEDAGGTSVAVLRSRFRLYRPALPHQDPDAGDRGQQGCFHAAVGKRRNRCVREVSGARLVELPAGHLSNVERPGNLCSDVLVSAPAPSTFAGTHAGRICCAPRSSRKRRVDRRHRGTSWLTSRLQQLITQYASEQFGHDTGLDLRTRRLLVLAMMAALGRWEKVPHARKHCLERGTGSLRHPGNTAADRHLRWSPAPTPHSISCRKKTDRLSAKETAYMFAVLLCESSNRATGVIRLSSGSWVVHRWVQIGVGPEARLR